MGRGERFRDGYTNAEVRLSFGVFRGHVYHVFDGPLSYWPTAGFWEGWVRDHDHPPVTA
jgi:hypothetical protein